MNEDMNLTGIERPLMPEFRVEPLTYVINWRPGTLNHVWRNMNDETEELVSFLEKNWKNFSPHNREIYSDKLKEMYASETKRFFDMKMNLKISFDDRENNYCYMFTINSKDREEFLDKMLAFKTMFDFNFDSESGF